VALDAVSQLAGTSDGRLYAFAADGALIKITEISLENASVGQTFQVQSPEPTLRLIGGYPKTSGFELVFSTTQPDAATKTTTWIFDPTSGEASLHASLDTDASDFVALATSPCDAMGK
jgi:hypothetical protein